MCLPFDIGKSVSFTNVSNSVALILSVLLGFNNLSNNADCFLPTFFKKNYDKEFNADFIRESGKKEDFFNQEGNFWIELHHKIYG